MRGGPVQDEPAVLARTWPASDSRPSGGTDGRSAPTSCPISRCVSGSGRGSRRARRAPSARPGATAAARSAHPRAGGGSPRADVELHRPPHAAAQRRVQDLRPGPDRSASPRRAPRRACARARASTSQTRAARRRRRRSTALRSPAPTSSLDVRSPTGRRARSRRRRAAGRSRARAAPAAARGRTPRPRSCRRAPSPSGARRAACDGRGRTELVVDVEQVAVTPVVSALWAVGERRSPRLGNGNGPLGDSGAALCIAALSSRWLGCRRI